MSFGYIILNVICFSAIGLVGGVFFGLVVGDSRHRLPRDLEVGLLGALVGGVLTFFLPILEPNQFMAGIGMSSISMLIFLVVYWIAYKDRTELSKEADLSPR